MQQSKASALNSKKRSNVINVCFTTSSFTFSDCWKSEKFISTANPTNTQNGQFGNMPKQRWAAYYQA